MHAPQDGTQEPDPTREDRPLRDGWRHLQVGLTVLGFALHLLGSLIILLGCLGLPSFSVAGAGYWGQWLLLAWAATPFASGLLVLEAADRLKRPGAEASTALVVAAAAAFVGFAWVAMPVAILTGGGLRS
jgi:hypothetical protein